MGRVALSSLYRREIESRVNDAICENAYCNIGLMGGAGPGDDRKKSHHFRDLQQGKGALRHQESFPILVEATYLAPLAIFFFRDEFAADSPLQGRVCELSVPDGGRSPSRSRHRHQSRRWSICGKPAPRRSSEPSKAAETLVSHCGMRSRFAVRNPSWRDSTQGGSAAVGSRKGSPRSRFGDRQNRG